MYGSVLIYIITRHYVYMMAFRNRSIYTVSFIGLDVVIIPVDNSGLKAKETKRHISY